MDSGTKWLFGIGALLALLVGVIAYISLSGSSRATTTTVSVVVARESIPERTLFTAANVETLLTTRELPPDALPTGALSNPNQAIGKTTMQRLVPGEILLDGADRLVSSEGVAARPAAAVPRDKVALTIPANEAISVAGAVQPGDRVDVIATYQAHGPSPVTQAIFQDVRVFAVGPWQGDLRERVHAAVGPSGIPSSITLLLDYQQAVALQHLLGTGGQLSLALRRFDQAGDLNIESVTPEVLIRRYFGLGAEPAPSAGAQRRVASEGAGGAEPAPDSAVPR